MEEVIRYLLVLNHPENSEFSDDTTFMSKDFDSGVVLLSFSHLLSIFSSIGLLQLLFFK